MSLINELKNKKYFKSNEVVEPNSIKIAEEELGLCFSKEYKEYLKEFGCVTIYGHEFTGLGNNILNDVVIITKKICEVDEKFPKNVYVIEEAHIDGILICQDEKGLVYKFKPFGNLKKIYDSFCDYVREL